MEYLIAILIVAWGINRLTRSSKRLSSRTEARNKKKDDDFRLSITISSSGPSSGFRQSESLSENFKKFWVPKDRSVSVGGRTIEGGLLYVGKNLAAADGYSVEPALINPKLKATAKHPDYAGDGFSYWPSYSDIPASSRAAYIEWLAGGRKDSNANIGYVFLYFYGLERRILHDHMEGAADKAERAAIFQEAKRLLEIYGDNGSFSGYCQEFLFAMFLGSGEADLTTAAPVIAPRSYNLPGPLRVGLGQFAKAGRPIPSNWALAWVLQDSEIRLRTPARRCEEEFAALFELMYRERHGEGLVVKPNKTSVSVSYRPATSGMGRDVETYRGPTLPDITVLKRPRTILADLADSATDKLDSYSRFIGKDGAGRKSIQGLALLPHELDGRGKHPGLEALRQEIESHLNGDDNGQIPFHSILTYFPTEKSDRLSKKEIVLLAQLLEKLGIGMEPDVRFCRIKAKPQESLIVFRQEADAPSAPSQAYEAAAFVMRMATMGSRADGEVTAEEESHIAQHIESNLDLDPGERRRLQAHVRWLSLHDAGVSGLKAKLEHLSPRDKENTAQNLVVLAAADGRIDPGEIKILRKLYQYLGLESERVIADLHNATTEPVTVRSASTIDDSYPIPKRPTKPIEMTLNEGRAALDPATLQRKLAETARVSGILTEIFADKEYHEPSMPTAADSMDADILEGLDAEHSGFLRALGASITWERSALEELADSYGLLLDGALDRINEAAFDRCDAPCIDEDDDEFVLDHEVYQEMTT